jgi:hypothetical protein
MYSRSRCIRTGRPAAASSTMPTFAVTFRALSRTVIHRPYNRFRGCTDLGDLIIGVT